MANSQEMGSLSTEERLAWLEEKLMKMEEILIGQDKLIEHLENEKGDLQEQLNFVQDQANAALDKCEALFLATGRGGGSTRVKPPKPRTFSGARDSKEVDNFIFDMEQYFRICKMEEEQKLDTATMYLVDDAKLWWRTKYADIAAGKVRIDTWGEFKKELMEQFYPENTEFLARDRLSKLQQTSSIREYVKEYSACMLDIKSMAEQDRVYNFIRGLKNWAQRELWRQKIDTLAQAISAAEKLMDFAVGRSDEPQRKGSSSNTRPGSPTPSSSSAGGGSRVASNSHRTSGGEAPRRSGASSPQRHKEASASTSSAHRAINAMTCILCRGPHKWFECKHKGEIDKIQKRLSSMTATIEPQIEEPDESASEDGSPKRIGAIRLLYSMDKHGSTSY